MKEFTEALKAHLKAHAVETFDWCIDTQGFLQEIDNFAASWRPAPPAPGVDTSPAALRALADYLQGCDVLDAAAALHAVADEKEAGPVARLESNGAAEWFALVMGAAAAIEDAAACLRYADAKRAAEGAAKHYREKANLLWQQAALERLTRIDEEIEQAPQEPAAENRAELLQEDIDSLNMCLDDAGAPREEGGRPLSLWGRVCRMAPQAAFLRAVSIEAEHQRQRWGAEGDAEVERLRAEAEFAQPKN